MHQFNSWISTNYLLFFCQENFSLMTNESMDNLALLNISALCV